jgi:hypothetical protein
MPNITPGFVLDFIQCVVLAILALVQWLRKPGHDAAAAVSLLRDHTDQQHTELRQHVDTMHATTHRDIAVLSERIAHMPTDEELAQLNGAVHALAETQKVMAAQLNRIENYLLNAKG